MNNLSNYTEKKLMDHIFGIATYTPPSNIYIALHLTDPTDSGGGSEVANANNYARVLHNSWNAASSRLSNNNGEITFNQCTTADWGTIPYWALWDSGTYGSGNMLCYGTFNTPKEIIVGNVPTITSGDINIYAVTNGISTYLANKLLDHLLKVTSYTPPTTIALANFTSSPGDLGTGNEVANANDYSRTVLTSWSPANATTGLITNTAIIQTPTASGGWGIVTHNALYDNATYGAGNLLWYGMMIPSQIVEVDDFLKWEIGNFKISLD